MIGFVLLLVTIDRVSDTLAHVTESGGRLQDFKTSLDKNQMVVKIRFICSGSKHWMKKVLSLIIAVLTNNLYVYFSLFIKKGNIYCMD